MDTQIPSHVALPRYRRSRLVWWIVIIFLLVLTLGVAYLTQRLGLLSADPIRQLLERF